MFYAMKMKSFPVSGVKSSTMHSTILENMRYASNKNMASRRLMSQGAQQNVKSNVNESSSLLSRFANKYLYYLDHYPIPVKAVTAGCMLGSGDVLCQFLVEKRTELDIKRFTKMLVIGTGLMGPLLHGWYLTLARLFPGTGAATAVKRVMADQLIFAPLFIPFFFSILAIYDGKSFDELKEQLRTKWLSTLLANWIYWVPAQSLNFGFVPLRLQVLVNNSFGLIWNIYLSMVSQSSNETTNAITTQSNKQ